jgi:DNA gyrase subunit A
MDLEPGDELVAARAARDVDDVILVSANGQAIRFNVGTLRVASRASGGVRGIRLGDGGRVIAMVVASDGDDLLVVSERGVGKRTPLPEYPQHGRGGQGVITFRVTDRSGPLAVARAVRESQEIMLVSRAGVMLRTRADLISQQGRSTQGVAVMAVEDGDALASLALIDLGPREP